MRPNVNRAPGQGRQFPDDPGQRRVDAPVRHYLTREYGALDSDYVFVNLWSGPHGRPAAR